MKRVQPRSAKSDQTGSVWDVLCSAIALLPVERESIPADCPSQAHLFLSTLED